MSDLNAAATLGVHHRAQAVTHVREIGLLDWTLIVVPKPGSDDDTDDCA